MTLKMCSASGNDLLNQVFLSEDHSQEESQKKRKLTNDSGYGDDINERIESLHSNSTVSENQIFTRTSSLDSISENHTGPNSTEQAFHEMRARFETSLNCDNNGTSSDNFSPDGISSDSFGNNGVSFDCVDSGEEQIVETSKTKEKRRRMTPVPGGVSIFKPSQSSPLATPSEKKKNCSGRTILFVEEEDHDDLEGYNLEDDFICPDLHSCTSKLHIKRNSWHGITEGEKFAKSNRYISLTKSKSLDRGTDYPRTRRKRLANMNIPSISLEELTIDKRPGLTKQRSLNGDFTESRCLFDGMNFINKSPSHKPDSTLPAWMQEAAEQDTEATARQEEMHCCEEKYEEEEKRSMETLSTKLAIPEINWDKLNEEKNKTNKLLSEQRKALNKEKTKASSRRRRKLTPSESPSQDSLEKLKSSFKTKSEEWTLTEEDEEEENL